MHFIKSFIIAISIYSVIPVPQFEWEERDMEYMMCFFPFVGVIIGAAVYLWHLVYASHGVGDLAYALIGSAIPIAITGGFHIDGFMDTMDALHSYRSKEEKLKILKDPHIGAFAVIMLALYGLIYVSAFSEVVNRKLIGILCSGFVLSRCLSGIAVVSFPAAKEEGMLHTFAAGSSRRAVKRCLFAEAFLCGIFMLWQSFFPGIVILISFFMVFLYYRNRMKKELGGITGDTAGYFVVLSEVVMMVIGGMLQHFI